MSALDMPAGLGKIRFMAVRRRMTLRCFFTAWIFGWVTAIFVPSVLLAVTGLSPLAASRGPFSATLAIADDMAPAAKIGFALLFAASMFAARRLGRSHGPGAVAVDMLLAAAAMLLTLAILPSDWSRGFGAALSGTRFALNLTLIYVAGALLAGMAFSIGEAKCLARDTGRLHPPS